MSQTPFPAYPLLSPLLSADDIATRLFNRTRSRRWVLKNVCPEKRIEFTSATIRWREYDVLVWMQTRPPRPSKTPRQGPKRRR